MYHKRHKANDKNAKNALDFVEAAGTKQHHITQNIGTIGLFVLHSVTEGIALRINIIKSRKLFIFLVCVHICYAQAINEQSLLQVLFRTRLQGT